MSTSTRAFIRRPAVLLVLALAGVGLVVSALGRLASGPAAEQKRIELSTGEGSEACPAFSPDGRRLAYSARDTGAQDVYHIFVRNLPSGAPLQLTSAGVGDLGPVWSPDGANLAFLRVSEGHARLMLIPSGGGAESQIAEFDTSQGDDARPLGGLSWTHDGKSLVAVESAEDQPSFLSLIAVSGGATRRLTNPPAKSPGDSAPAVSPDGRKVAFTRAADEESGDVYVCDLSGSNLQRMTFDGHPVRGIAWTPDGRELVYTANRAMGWRLWRVPVYGGSPREVLLGGREAGAPAIAPKGQRLAVTETATAAAIWRAELGSPDAAAKAQASIRSPGRESRPSWSPDGKTISDVSDQSGTDEIWLANADGSNRRQLTNLKARRLAKPHWAPDSRSIVFAARTDRGWETYAIPVSTVHSLPAPVRLPPGAQTPSWSHDGKWIYFESEGLIWRAAPDGSNLKALTNRRSVAEPEESADGKYVYYYSRNRRSIGRVPAGGGEEEEAIVPDHDLWWTTIQPVAKGVYYLEFNRGVRMQIVMFHDFRTQKNVEVFGLKDADISPESTFSISPDGKYILYSKVDRSATNLVLVENFQ